MSERREGGASGTGRRLPIVIVVVGLLVAAAAVGDRHTRATAAAREAAVAEVRPAGGVRSSAWYCSGGPVAGRSSLDQVTVSNVGAHPVRVAIDTMVAARPVVERFVSVPARASTTLSVARLS